MKQKFLSLAVLVAVFALFLPSVSWADGGLIPSPNYYVYENQQKAAILFEDGIETLAIQIGFQGNAKDFAWVIPLPSKPEVSKVSNDLFANLEELTKIDDFYYTNSVGFMGSAEDSAKGVEIIEQTQVGYYDVTTLKASDASSLSVWLNKNGYKFPEAYQYLLNDYINSSWYFVAVKIVPESQSVATTDLRSGQATPLLFKFETKNIIFPMKLSRISAVSQIGMEDTKKIDSEMALYYPTAGLSVEIYTIAQHKKTINGFSTVYADNFKAEEIEDLSQDINGNSWVTLKDKKYFITRLSNTYYAENMGEDLFIKDAEDNSKVNNNLEWWGILETIAGIVLAVVISLGVAFAIFAFSPIGLLFIIPSIIIRARKDKDHKACRALQIIATVLTIVFAALAILLVLAFMSSVLDNSLYSHEPQEYISYLSSYIVPICLALLMIAIIIFEIIIINKQKKYVSSSQT